MSSAARIPAPEKLRRPKTKGAVSSRDDSTRSLKRFVHQVRDVAVGDETAFDRGVLTVGRAASTLFDSPALAGVRLTWASPGDPVRIVKLLDAVEPRCKEGGGIFPGFVGPPEQQGVGTTHVLSGAAVVTAGFLPRAQEAVVDMAGPAQPLSFLGATHNLVVEFTPAADADWEDVDAALRVGALKLAEHLAAAATSAPPDAAEELAGLGAPGSSELPRVAAVTNLQTQGKFKDVFVYGTSFSAEPPRLIDPNELEDGAVVSGQYGHPALKNPTYVHQNHPIAAALRRRHGRDLHFAGLVICPEPVDQTGKERASADVAALCRDAGFDAVIITKEGGGNADADVSLKMDALEQMGISAIGLFAEMAGADGSAPPLVIAPANATAMVSTGNYDHRVELPAVERALGGEDFSLLDVPATAELSVPVAVVYGSLSPLGIGRLTCREAA
jgi:glycine reductase complex component B subunit alpha and beta